jgi:hypothetical protein
LPPEKESLDYSALEAAPPAPATFPSPDAASHLEDHVVLGYIQLERGLLIYAVDPRGIHAVWRPISKAELEGVASKFYRELTDTEAGAAWLDDGRRLHHQLIAPVAQWLDPAKTVAIENDGATARILFGALVARNGIPFGERFALAYVQHDGPGPVGSGEYKPLGRAVVAVVPGFAEKPQFPALPGADAETAAVLAAFPRALVLRGSAAIRRRIEGELPIAGLFHFTGHAVAGPGGDAALVLPPEARPADEPELMAADAVSRVRFHNRPLVVLAACDTADGEFDPWNPDSLVRIPGLRGWRCSSCARSGRLAGLSAFHDRVLCKLAARALRAAGDRPRGSISPRYHATPVLLGRLFRVCGLPLGSRSTPIERRIPKMSLLFFFFHGPMVRLFWRDRIELLVPDTVDDHDFCLGLGNVVQHCTPRQSYRLSGVMTDGNKPCEVDTDHHPTLIGETTIDHSALRSFLFLPLPAAMVCGAACSQPVHWAGAPGPAKPDTVTLLGYTIDPKSSLSLAGDFGYGKRCVDVSGHSLALNLKLFPGVVVGGLVASVNKTASGSSRAHAHAKGAGHSATLAFNQMMRLLPQCKLRMAGPHQLSTTNSVFRGGLDPKLENQLAKAVPAIKKVITSVGGRECLGCSADNTE